ncbi:MAG: hypothetical protein ACJ746_06655 [Bryobacteraceae bacterium]
MGGSVSYAADVNNAGQVAGTSYTSTGGTHAFLYDDNHLIDLGTLGSGIFSNGEAINEAGQVVGGSTVFGSFVYHAFVYSSGQMTDLNALIDQKLDLTLDYAEAINDSGQIVATGRVAASGGTHTFLLTPIPEPSTLTLFGLPTLLLLGAVTLSHTKAKSRNK